MRIEDADPQMVALSYARSGVSSPPRDGIGIRMIHARIGRRMCCRSNCTAATFGMGCASA